KLTREPAQTRAQPLLEHGVIERHPQQALHSHLLLDRPCEQMREVLGLRPEKLCAAQNAVVPRRVKPHEADVAGYNASAALCLKRDLCDFRATAVEACVRLDRKSTR